MTVKDFLDTFDPRKGYIMTDTGKNDIEKFVQYLTLSGPEFTDIILDSTLENTVNYQIISSRNTSDTNSQSRPETAVSKLTVPVSSHDTSTSSTGGSYVGEKNISEQRHGKGICQFENGDVYEGDWIENKMAGQGVYKYASGNVYEGGYMDNLMNGRGVYKYTSSGNVYEGEFKDGKMAGKGLFKYASGSTYEGEFRDNKSNGQGLYKYANGNIYEGEWKNDKKHGQGIYKYANGDIFEGQFMNGKMHGTGIFRTADGTSTSTGIWENGNRKEL